MCATALSWQYDGHDLGLCQGTLRERVPPLVTALLTRDDCHAMTEDPAADLLRLELDLRRYARFLRDRAADTEDEMAYGRDSVTLATGESGRAGRHHHRLALEYLATAAMLHVLWKQRERHAERWIRHVRQFVIEVAVAEGPLAEAAAGWRRRPEPPAFVVVFDSTSAFVAADNRRADGAWWAHRINTAGGVVFGSRWRRDSDDDDQLGVLLPHTGRWQIAYLPQTGEVYGVRCDTRRPEAVWLLSGQWGDQAQVACVLERLITRMGEPNSLILVAEALHTARDARATGCGPIGSVTRSRHDVIGWGGYALTTGDESCPTR